MPGTTYLPERLLIAAAVVLTCVLFTREALDPVNVIKLTALLLVAIALIAVVAYRVVRTRTVTVPVSPAGVAAMALSIVFVISAVTAPVTTTAVVGAYGRNSGLLAYLAALVLFVVGLRVFTDGRARTLVGGVVFAGLFTATYGLLQKAGIDAIPWNNPFNPIIAALGNPNFASGYMGVAGSLAAGGAFYRGWALPWRALAAATAALCILAAVLSSSVQGPIAGTAGLLTVALTVILNSRSRFRTALLAGLGGMTATGLGLLLVGGLTKSGPAARLFLDVGSEARTHYWGAALQMFRDAPVLGVGLDQYGTFWRRARSVDSVEALGGGQYSDAAHSVPLQMLAQGGLLLGVVYALFVVALLAALVTGLVRLRGDDRMLLGALGAGWVAYQVQAAVSIDQVPLIVLHFTLAAAVVAASGTLRLRVLTLPGAPKPAVPHPNDRRTKKRTTRTAAPPRRAMSPVDLVVLAAMGVLVSTAAWSSLIPLRANVAALDGNALKAAGDGSGAFAAYDRATTLLPGQASYWGSKGELFRQATPPQTAQSLAAYTRAVDADPYDVNVLLAAASLAEREGDLDKSRRLHDRALQVDPINPTTIVATSTFELRHSGAERARSLLEDAVERIPDSATLWATLGDARLVLGADDAARMAYERALRLESGQAVASAGLEKLAAGV